LILAALLLCSLAACGAAEKEPEVYVPSEDIEVAVAIVQSGKAKAVTRKLTDKELTSVDLCCVYFDLSGKQIGEAEIVQCDFSQDAELSVWTFNAAAESQYMKAAISSVTYADGTKNSCPGVESWANQASLDFNVESYSKELEEMAGKEGAAAEKCDAAEITLGTPVEGKLELGVKNISGKEIDEVIAYLLWFDAEGNPIEMNGVFVPNSEKISAKTLAVDEEATYTATAPEGAASAKGIVQSVTFTGGESWANDYIYEWALVNYGKAQ
jgi:hypothetical protein